MIGTTIRVQAEQIKDLQSALGDAYTEIRRLRDVLDRIDTELNHDEVARLQHSVDETIFDQLDVSA